MDIYKRWKRLLAQIAVVSDEVHILLATVRNWLEAVVQQHTSTWLKGVRGCLEDKKRDDTRVIVDNNVESIQSQPWMFNVDLLIFGSISVHYSTCGIYIRDLGGLIGQIYEVPGDTRQTLISTICNYLLTSIPMGRD